MLGALKRAAALKGCTTFATMLAAYGALLHRLSGQSDVVIGLAAAGQATVGNDNLVGHCVSLLPFRSVLPDGVRFSDYLHVIKTSLMDAFDHQSCTYGSLLGKMKLPRDTSRLPLVSVTMTHEMETPGIEFAGLESRVFANSKARCNFDLELYLAESPAGLNVLFCYNTDLFSGETIERWLGHFRVLIEALLRDMDTTVGTLPIWSDADSRRVLVEWNDTAVEHPRDICLHELIEAQVAKTPDALAVVFEHQTVTYRELDARSNRLASALQAHGVGPDVLVGLCLERSIEMVVGLLAILKAGGAYVPVDPEYPPERIGYMLEDARVPVLLTHTKLRASLPAGEAHVICLDTFDWLSAAGKPPSISDPSSARLAYVLYTSGSTGKPKGVAIPHVAICNHMLWMQRAFPLTSQDRVLQKTPISFDASVWEFYAPLLAGATLVMARPGGHMDPEYLARTVAQHGITVLQTVPTMLQMLVEEPAFTQCHTLRHQFCGGEALTCELAERFAARLPWACLINLYGPTEAAIDVTCWTHQSGDYGATVPIGRPVDNMRVYVVDRQHQPVPVGVPGELWIGGVQLARGYWNKPELTAEKFLRDPFCSEPGERIYRTGDLVRFRADGGLEFLGRIDHQIKLRGFRIELGEIETQIKRHPVIKEVVVVAREDPPGEKRLVAYYTTNPGVAASSTELCNHLRTTLPDYMVPVFMALEHMPLMPNGKIDRNSLPVPERPQGETERTRLAPRTPVEEMLATVWKEVLKLEAVGVDDNFFEIGGDSILAIQISNRARKAGLQIAPRQFFHHQTIAELAAIAAPAGAAADEQGSVQGPMPLTPIQRWFFEQDLPEAHHWNQAFVFELAERPAIDLLARAFRATVLHHDALRLRFSKSGDAWTQQYGEPAGEIDLVTINLADRPQEQQAAAITAAAERMQASLHIENGPLLRATYFDLGPDCSGRLFIAIHHLVVDGVSWRILLEDFDQAYQQLRAGQPVQLAGKTASFKRWAERLVEHVRAGALLDEIAYWSALPTPSRAPLPPDVPVVGPNDEASMDTVIVKLSADETQDLLKRVPPVYNTQINDVMITALALSLGRRSGAEELALSLEGHGREELWDDIDVSRTVGWFTSLFPVCLQIRPDATPGEALKTIKEQLRQIPRRGVGFGLLRYLAPDGATRQELAAVLQHGLTFNYLGQFDQLLAGSKLLRFAEESPGAFHGARDIRVSMLEINAVVIRGQMEIHWSYSKNLHQTGTIDEAAQDFVRMLRELIAHCLSSQAGGFTPSDFASAGLNQEQLNHLLAELGEAN